MPAISTDSPLDSAAETAPSKTSGTAESSVVMPQVVSVVSSSTTTSVVAGSIPSEKAFAGDADRERLPSIDSQPPTSPPVLLRNNSGKRIRPSLTTSASEESLEGRLAGARLVAEDVFPEVATALPDSAVASSEEGNDKAQECFAVQADPEVLDVDTAVAGTASSRFVVEDTPVEDTTSQAASPSSTCAPDAGTVAAPVTSTPLPLAAATSRFAVEDVHENTELPADLDIVSIDNNKPRQFIVDDVRSDPSSFEGPLDHAVLANLKASNPLTDSQASILSSASSLGDPGPILRNEPLPDGTPAGAPPQRSETFVPSETSTQRLVVVAGAPIPVSGATVGGDGDGATAASIGSIQRRSSAESGGSSPPVQLDSNQLPAVPAAGGSTKALPAGVGIGVKAVTQAVGASVVTSSVGSSYAQVDRKSPPAPGHTFSNQRNMAPLSSYGSGSQPSGVIAEQPGSNRVVSKVPHMYPVMPHQAVGDQHLVSSARLVSGGVRRQCVREDITSCTYTVLPDLGT